MRGDLVDRVADLEQQLAAISVAGRQRQARPAQPFPPRHVRLAITCLDPAYGTYPSFGADTYPIKMIDAKFTEAGGTNAVTVTARSAAGKFYARALDASGFIPNGTVVEVAYISGRWWIVSNLSRGLFGQVSTTLPATGGGSGVVELFDSAFNDLLKTTNAVALTAYPIGVGTFVNLVWDPVQSRFYTPDRQSVLLGTVSGTSINAGTTGSIVIKDDQGNTLYTQNNVRALTLLVRSQQVAVVFDYVKAEFFAFPLNVPLICQATAAIAYQASGTVNILDSTKANAGGVLTPVSGYAFFRAIAKNEFCLGWWDYYAGKFYLVPLAAAGDLLGLLATTNIDQDTTGAVKLITDRGVDLLTTITVRAFADLIRSDVVRIGFDTTNNEFYAIPIGRPILGIAQADIATGAAGNFSTFDGKGLTRLVTRSAYASLVNIRNNQVCLLTWDYVQNVWFATPVPGGGKAAMLWGMLAGALAAGGSVLCNVGTAANGTSPGATVTVYTAPGSFQFTGASGKHYTAYYSPEDDKYYFLSVEC